MAATTTTQQSDDSSSVNLAAESLTCGGCGNDGPETLQDAVVEGWTRLVPDPAGLSWNYVGECPDCDSVK